MGVRTWWGQNWCGCNRAQAYPAALQRISHTVLQQLWKATNETVNLGILDGQDVYYVDVVQSAHPFRMASAVGWSQQVCYKAIGKALTAYLPADEKEHVLSSIRFEHFTARTPTRLPQLRKELEKVRRRPAWVGGQRRRSDAGSALRKRADYWGRGRG